MATNAQRTPGGRDMENRVLERCDVCAKISLLLARVKSPSDPEWLCLRTADEQGLNS